jgi:hypothetical protein
MVVSLSMQRKIQANSPLPYKIIESEGIYSFKSNQGLIYSCFFHYITPLLPPLLGIYDLEIYDFEFYPFDPVPEKRKTADPRIAPTIVELLSKLLSNKNRVLAYICDSSDGRAKQRQHLFRKWHEQHCTGIDRYQLEITHQAGSESYLAYGSILVRSDFEHHEVLKSELIEKAAQIIAAKYLS